ncbi:MAG: iron ABC transporter permease [Hyphomicrobiales bacterium]|nr:iron ABC transporter permease [Hyphomicrobiales bacterium]
MTPGAEPVAPVQPPRRWLTTERTASGLALLISLIISLPLLTIIAISLTPAPGVWPHLISTTLPYSLQQTLMLLAGVALVTLIAGGGTAWLITMYRFPGRGLFDWLMILPLALPTYITAYCYGEFLEYSGPVQEAVRAIGGFNSFQDYWFPPVRSLGGAVFILSAVLYPYVYMTARASFSVQSVHVLEVARTLGRTGVGALFAVALPMARPALAAGVSLALMECLNDIGAVSYLGVSTLTLSVYDAWIQRSSLAGAAQLALVMFIFVVFLLTLERYGRRNVRFQTSRTDRPVSQTVLSGGKGLLAAFVCFVPFAFGFLIPIGVLIDGAVTQGAHAAWRDYLTAAQNSLLLSAISAGAIVACAIVIGGAMRITHGRIVTGAARISSLGYAIPGTVIGIGLIVPLAAFDNAISAYFNENFGFRTGLLLSGSAFALLLAYTIRFMAVGFGAIDAGWQRLSPSLDAAARTLGASPLRMLGQVHLPLLRPAIGAAALLVFVDCMKELSATLLLRPFNFETLATHIYVYASQEQFEKSAIAALTIVAAGLIPLILLHRTLTSPHALTALPEAVEEKTD